MIPTYEEFVEKYKNGNQTDKFLFKEKYRQWLIDGVEVFAGENKFESNEELVYVNIDELSMNADNFYKCEDISQLSEDIRINGLQFPLSIDNDNLIISGHRRYLALKELNKKEVLCLRKNFKSINHKEISLISSNNYRTKSKEERTEEVKRLHDLYSNLKNTDPNYANININKLISGHLSVSSRTVARDLKDLEIVKIKEVIGNSNLSVNFKIEGDLLIIDYSKNLKSLEKIKEIIKGK